MRKEIVPNSRQHDDRNNSESKLRVKKLGDRQGNSKQAEQPAETTESHHQQADEYPGDPDNDVQDDHSLISSGFLNELSMGQRANLPLQTKFQQSPSARN